MVGCYRTKRRHSAWRYYAIVTHKNYWYLYRNWQKTCHQPQTAIDGSYMAYTCCIVHIKQ